MVRDNRHNSAYIFCAICPVRGVDVAMILAAANTEAMSMHLTKISIQVTDAHGALVVCGGAGWHQRGQKLQAPANISLLFLPPTSPRI
jgi:hypothetical protein